MSPTSKTYSNEIPLAQNRKTGKDNGDHGCNVINFVSTKTTIAVHLVIQNFEILELGKGRM